MAFGCFAPSADTYATLPKGVALADPNAALSRRHSTKPTLSSAYRPSLDYSSTPTMNGETEGLARSATTGRIRQGVKKVVHKALIGFPTQFVHSSHVGQDHIDRIIEEKSGLEDLSAAFTGSPSSYHPSTLVVEEEVSGSSHDGADIVKRVKRKAAPVYVPSKIIAAAARAEESEELYAKDIELPIPLDDRGRPMHFVGGHYMTNTTKVKWDGTMDEITKALKMSY